MECCSASLRKSPDGRAAQPLEPMGPLEPGGFPVDVSQELLNVQRRFTKQEELLQDVVRCLKASPLRARTAEFRSRGSARGSKSKSPGSNVLDLGSVEERRRTQSSQASGSSAAGSGQKVTFQEVPSTIIGASSPGSLNICPPVAEERADRRSVDRMRRASARNSFVRSLLTDYTDRARAAAEMEFGHPFKTEDPQGGFGSNFRRCAYVIVTSPFAAHSIMALILVNLVLLGVEVDVSSSLGQDDIPRWFDVVNIFIVSIFTFELIMSFIGFGFYTFFRGPDRWWNIFDFVIINLSVFETLMQLWAPGLISQMRYMRFMRLARALRGMRVVKLLRYVSALRTLIFSIIHTTGSLMWTLVLLVLLFYSFGVILTQVVTDHCRFETVEATGDSNAVPVCDATLAQYWSSVPESMLTLFMSISGGISWVEPLMPLRDVSLVAVSCLLLYIFLTVFAVLNVVTGVFCHTAIESASADKEIVVMSQMQKNATQMSVLRDMFWEMDKDLSSMVSVDELEESLKSEKFSSFLESMDISTQDVWTLFMIIDSDQNGLIDLEEFVSGCMQLHGPAKSIQMARMSHENKVTRQTIKKLISEIVDMKAQLTALMPDEEEAGPEEPLLS